jgi:hypothetical protein
MDRPFENKELRVLESILEESRPNDSKQVELFSVDVELDSEDFRSILKSFVSKNWIQLDEISEHPFQIETGDEITSPEVLVADLLVLDPTKLEKQFNELKSKYPARKQEFKKTRGKTFGGYDAKRSMLSFAGKTILISKTNGSDAHKLMVTLAKDPRKLWYSDEIYEDWGYLPEDQETLPRLKLYLAARTVCEAVEKETSIQNFLVPKTRQVEINPKYLA